MFIMDKNEESHFWFERRAFFLKRYNRPMSILTTIHRAAGVNLHGKTIQRTAVRGVIQRGQNLLMIYSSNVGDYKFPGGGVDEGESHTQALRREVSEECGATVTRIGEEIGVVIEYNFAEEAEFDTFKMTSHYYPCDVEDGFGSQNLIGYERDLGFQPIWISISDALRQNKTLPHSAHPPEWLRREIFVLEYLLIHQ
jgi:8-oxo-dGTP pyrophosphatase MutT (NUDIX family)